MKKELLIAITVIACSVILGGSVITSQLLKQNSIEKQQEIKRQEAQAKTDQEERFARYKEILLDACIDRAKEDAWSYLELNGTKHDDGSVWATNTVQKEHQRREQQGIDNCYKRHE